MNYKKLLLRNVFGKPVNINIGSGSDSDNKDLNLSYDENNGVYYTTINGTNTIVATSLTKTTVDVAPPIPPSTVRVAYIFLNPSQYHVTGAVDAIDITNVQDTSYDYSTCTFIGRFLANKDDVNIILPADIHPAETNPSIKAGNTYEYNIFDGVFNLIDVTTE